MNDKTYLIYMHINKINGKVYIGQTSTKAQKRWGSKGINYSGKTIFAKAIKKYGWDCFEHKILLTDLTKEQANLMEKELIDFYKSTDRLFGYNQKEGGSNGKWIESEKDKIRGCGNPFYGKKHTIETKEKLRLSSLGEKNHFYGKHHTEETKKKISQAKKGCSVWNKGIPRSEETKQKIRETKRRNRKNMKGVA